MTRTEIESEIKSIADDCAFTMPLWLAGMVSDECKRQKLKSLKSEREDYVLTAICKDDPRIVLLRRLRTNQLTGVLCDLVSDDIGITPTYLAIGMEPLFKDTQPEALLELLVTVIRERLKK